MQENQGCFSDARWALFWSADVLRRRYFPKIGSFWRESGDLPVEREEVDLTVVEAGMKSRSRSVEKSLLPDDDDSRHALALKVEDILHGLGAHGLLLRQLAWGDGWSAVALKQAMAHRELGRRQGLRIRLNYVDEVGGVEQIPVTNADGSITYTTKALPLTADQQAQKDQLTQIMNDSLAQIQSLSATDYQNDPATQQVLDQWKTAQQKILDDSSATRTQQEEQTLASRGLSDSSAADAVRRTRRLDQQSAEQNLSDQEGEIGSEVRSQSLQLQQQLYNLAASGIDSGQAATQADAAKSFSSSISADATRQASLLDYYEKTLPSSGYSVFDTALQRSAGSGVAQGILGVPGSLLGSLFGN